MKSEELKKFYLEFKDKVSKSASNFLYRAYLAQKDFEISLNTSELRFNERKD